MVTREQKEYVRMLECVMPEKDILVSLKDDDNLLRWYLRRSRRGYHQTLHLISWIKKSMDFWLSVGDDHVNMEAVVLNYSVRINQKTIIKYKNKLPMSVWSIISLQTGLTQRFLEKCADKLELDKIDLSSTKLTESFMRKHKKLLNWDNISLSQRMSKKFMAEFMELLNVGFLCMNPNIQDSKIIAVFGNGVYKSSMKISSRCFQ